MNTERQTRISLLGKIRHGRDEAAWAEFVKIYKNFLYVVVRNMNVSHHDAEDILQEVLCKVWDKIADFQYEPDKGKFRHWLCAITRNKVIDHFRALRRQAAPPGGAGMPPPPAEETTLPEVDVLAEVEWRNYLANLALEKVKRELGANTVECFVAKHRGESVQNISQRLGVAENTIYVNCARVKERVRKKIQEIELRL